MKIQNEKFEQDLDPLNTFSLDGEQKTAEGQKAEAHEEWLKDGKHSVEQLRQLEKMLHVKTNPLQPEQIVRKRDNQMFVGGTLTGLILLFCCQAGISLYSQAQPALVSSPTYLAAQDAMLRLALKAEKSMITGIVDSDTHTASFYWTIDLKNTSGTDQEARAELKLPPGAVVSRATLWVNGVPQEAAFNTTASVTHAYNWITVSHRDPLLVTYKDAGTVSIKASPVPANGDVMRIRLGITAPLNIGEEGQGFVSLPELKESNFTVADKNNIHIESKRGLVINNKLLSEEQSPTGKHLITGDLTTGDLSKIVISAPASGTAQNFAVRATHSLPGTYILSSKSADSDSEFAFLERKKCVPEERIVTSEAAAHRVSTLWASREIARLLTQGRVDEAQDLAMIYRVVSPVSGAVVMEMDSDYARMNLHRDQYMVSVPGQKPIASKYPQPVTPILQGSSAGAPSLMGATNGTIESNATVVQGVNTAGTVRINPDANLDALVNLLLNAGCFGCFIAALYYAQRAARKTFSSGFKAGLTDALIAVSLVFCATAWTVLLPFIALYKLVAWGGKKMRSAPRLKSKLT
jgi:hypothetical protein